MAAAFPMALRARFQEGVEEGLSGRAAAARLKLSAATGVRWLRRFRERGGVAPDIQDQPKGCAKRAQDGDITLPERAGALKAATDGVAHPASIGRSLRKLGEVVLLFRAVSRQFKMDQAFI